MTEMLLSSAIVALLAFTAFLAALETVLTRLDLVRALRLKEERAAADGLVWLLEHRATSLQVVLLSTVVARLTLATTAVVLGTRLIDGVVGTAAALALVSAASLVFGEVAPRTATLRALEDTSLRLVRPARLLVRLLTPVSGLIVAVGRTVGRGGDVSGPYAEEHVDEFLDNEDEDTELDQEERQMIRSVIELGDTIAREIMVPRPDVVTVPEDASLRDVVELVVRHGYSRLPVVRGHFEDVLGIVHAKDVLARIASDPDGSWDDLLRPAVFVPETKRGDDLLRELQSSATHLAVAVDEYGAISGIVTIEDILEEIVGEIVDEHDHEAPLVAHVAGGRLRVDARLPVDELCALLSIDLPDDGWDTVGGLVVGTLGKVPRVGESLELAGVAMTVERMQGRRVSRVLIEPPLPNEEAS